MLYINLLLVFLFLFLLGRYLYNLYREGLYRPENWARALKDGKISPPLYQAYKSYPDKIRFFAWWLQVERIKREQLGGSFAELGVYKGESAKVLHLMDPSRVFHLFDTFDGFKDADLAREEGEAATYSEQHFADTSLVKVQQFLGKSEHLRYHPGYFPQTTAGLEKERFALVNIDADLYKPIHAALGFFYPRLVPGGAIFVHDYTHKWDGCRKAVDDFLKSIPESAAFLPDQDGSVLILKNRANEHPASRKNL